MPRSIPRSRPFVTPLIVLCLMVTALPACTQLPQFAPSSRIPPGPAPQLIPIQGILVQADALRPAAAATGSLQSRAAALRARALRLRQM